MTKKKSLNKHKIKKQRQQGKKHKQLSTEVENLQLKKKVPINKMKNIFNIHFCFQKWFCTN